jgi:quercetin dioxygenase-like cupin family protein
MLRAGKNTSLGDAAMRLWNLVAIGLLLACSISYAQEPMPKITPIMEVPITGQPDKELVMLSIEWPPESISPLHTHPGDEYGVVIKGAYAIKLLNGQWKTYTAGEGFHLPAGVVHEGKNTTFSTTTIHAYVVEKGKTLIQAYTKP